LKTYNVDNRLKDIEVIKKSIKIVCKSKKKKMKGENKKYYKAQEILEDIDTYADKLVK